MQRFLGTLVAASLCLLPGLALAQDKTNWIDLTNAGERELRCQYLLAHWMSGEILRIAPGESVTLVIYRSAEGALYLRQIDDPRPLYVESLLCGPDLGFGEDRQQIDLSPLRQGASRRLAVSCATAPPLCRADPQS
ncbi:MAG: hypothetical protein Kilf2KO_15960 [Rhodospirillales bacterium]